MALDMSDKDTKNHHQRITEITLKLSQVMGINSEPLVPISRGALIPDIGKMGVPDSILFKLGKLYAVERDIMKQHPVFASQLLYSIPFLGAAVDIPPYHLEKWDESGYPIDLKGEQIPLPARIFIIVDVRNALSSNRPNGLSNQPVFQSHNLLSCFWWINASRGQS